MASQRFAEDGTGTLVFYPPEKAVPSSATVVLYKPDEAVLQASAAATIDTTSTTCAGASYPKGAASFDVDSATGIVAGNKYLVEDSGQVWECEVRSISGTTVYPVGRLPFSLNDASTVKGYRLSYSITATHTADVDTNYQARWSYTVNGAALGAPHVQLWDVVGSLAYYNTTLADVVGMWPWIEDHLHAHELDGTELLDRTWELMLLPALKGKGMDLDRVKDLDALKPLHIAMCNQRVAENLSMVDDAKVDAAIQARSNVSEVLAQTLSDVSWYDRDDDLVADDSEEHRPHNHSVVSR